jgi:hypothetical protein
MHPEFGLVKLNEEIDWISIIQNPEISEDKVRKPSKGVQFLRKSKVLPLKWTMKKFWNLEKPQTEEEWMKNLPFDMKKVMTGNKRKSKNI